MASMFGEDIFDGDEGEAAVPTASQSQIIHLKNGATSGFEMCFATGSQPKHVLHPDSVIKKFIPYLIYYCFC